MGKVIINPTEEDLAYYDPQDRTEEEEWEDFWESEGEAATKYFADKNDAKRYLAWCAAKRAKGEIPTIEGGY